MDAYNSHDKEVLKNFYTATVNGYMSSPNHASNDPNDVARICLAFAVAMFDQYSEEIKKQVK